MFESNVLCPCQVVHPVLCRVPGLGPRRLEAGHPLRDRPPAPPVLRGRHPCPPGSGRDGGERDRASPRGPHRRADRTQQPSGLRTVRPDGARFCARQGLAATVVYADLDAFKSINDTFGHAEGDRAIREAADLLASTFRASDVVARVGGDEFCILLTGAGSAEEPIIRLHDLLELRNHAPGVRYPLAFSIGRAAFDPDAPTTLDEILTVADTAMYLEKVGRRAQRREGPRSAASGNCG